MLSFLDAVTIECKIRTISNPITATFSNMKIVLLVQRRPHQETHLNLWVTGWWSYERMKLGGMLSTVSKTGDTIMTIRPTVPGIIGLIPLSIQNQKSFNHEYPIKGKILCD